ncbi:MAG: tRNA (adenosine(37)-N6)-threonylcarbamoyltransferase complex dimerization subunit type 1 TsaB [Treponema sp.]
MNILAIDTLGNTLSVAAHGPKGSILQSFTGTARTHAEQLLPLIDSVVSAAGFTAGTIDMVLAPEGPGSFTGLRLGYAVAKALQLNSAAHFVPVPTLACIANKYAAWSGGLAVVLDAKRNRFYMQLFKNNQPLCEPSDKTAEEILPLLDSADNWLITGYGTAAFMESPVVREKSERLFCVETDPLCFAHSMIAYAHTYTACTAIAASDYAGPVYIRKSDAEKD